MKNKFETEVSNFFIYINLFKINFLVIFGNL